MSLDFTNSIANVNAYTKRTRKLYKKQSIIYSFKLHCIITKFEDFEIMAGDLCKAI